MNKLTFHKLMAYSFYHPALLRDVVKSFGGYKSFKLNAADVKAHGVDVGWARFISTNYCIEFFVKNRRYILDVVKNESCSGDISNILADFPFVYRHDITHTDIIEVFAATGKAPESNRLKTAASALTLLAVQAICNEYVYLEEQLK